MVIHQPRLRVIEKMHWFADCQRSGYEDSTYCSGTISSSSGPGIISSCSLLSVVHS